MRVLLVTRNFPPLVGGMERLAHRVYLALAEEFDIGLVGPKGCEAYLAPGSRVRSCRLSPITAFLVCLQWKALRLAKVYRPDLIVATSGVAAPAGVLAGRAAGAAVACFLHGLDLVADSAVYRRIFVPAIRGCDLLIANSRHTSALATQAGVNCRKLHVLHPGVSIPTKRALPVERRFRALVGAEGRRLLLSVGRIHPRKGLAEFVAEALPPIVAKHPDVLLAIIGDEARNAVDRSTGEKERISRLARSRGVETNLVFVGPVTDAMLEAAYAESDVLVFPVIDRPGDVEGFGMVAVEAAAHGLPTVAFATGGVPDAVEHEVSGFLVPAGDYAAFSDAVETVLTRGGEGWRERCVSHARAFGWDRFGQRLRDLCAEVAARRSS